ncbi:MAG: asparaginase [Lachnospiraceae bacterium]|nr:asparaginase [Lachnospiraceae bacterium]
MKSILWIGTGGTIASEISDSGLAPALSSEQIAERVPEIRDICHVDCSEACNLDSTDMTPAEWLKVASMIREQYDNYDGFVITHGTDTLAYTAAALSYLIQDSPKPIILTGAQKPIGSKTTDSRLNLYDSFVYASSEESAGVAIVFNGLVIQGNRARKVRSKSMRAFASLNYPVLAEVLDGQIRHFIRQPSDRQPVFFSELDTKVALIKLIPGCDASLLRYALSENDAVIIESFGAGGLPSQEERGFYQAVSEGVERGKTVIITTQVENEGSDLARYRVGYQYKNGLRILEAFDMTTEAVLAKTMWILAQTKDPDEIGRLFMKPVGNDIC